MEGIQSSDTQLGGGGGRDLPAAHPGGSERTRPQSPRGGAGRAGAGGDARPRPLGAPPSGGLRVRADPSPRASRAHAPPRSGAGGGPACQTPRPASQRHGAGGCSGWGSASVPGPGRSSASLRAGMRGGGGPQVAEHRRVPSWRAAGARRQERGLVLLTMGRDAPRCPEEPERR